MFTNLVFDGGGARGIAYIGSIKVLEKKDLMKNFTKFAGTSVGSIIATALAVGYTSSELEELLLDKNFNDFRDNSNYFALNIYNFITNYGWYRGDKLRNWVEENLFKKTGIKNITLGQILEKYGKELIIVTSDLNTRRAVYFNPHDNPNLAVKDAIRMSASIPFFFDSFYYEGHYYMDGGILDSYPFEYFPDDEKTLGFRLKIELIHMKEEEDKIYWMKDFLTAFMKTILNKIERLHVKDSYNKQSVTLNVDVGITEFEIPIAKKLELIRYGAKVTKKFFEDLHL